MTSSALMKAAALAAFGTLLAGCGGGGGGSKPNLVSLPPPPPPAPRDAALPFDNVWNVRNDFVSLDQPQTGPFEMRGAEARVAGRLSAQGAVSALSPDDFGPFRATFAREGAAFSSVALQTASGAALWTADPATTTQSGGLRRLRKASGDLLVSSPSAFSYQSFGAWSQASGRSFEAGGFSVGATTAEIPRSGSAVFVGAAAAHYVDASGAQDLLRASARIEADFAARSMSFSTSGSAFLSGRSADGMDVAKTQFSYDPASKGFSAAIAAGGMTGALAGRFYGPGAQEVGGLFSLKGAGLEALSGAFGAARRD